MTPLLIWLLANSVGAFTWWWAVHDSRQTLDAQARRSENGVLRQIAMSHLYTDVLGAAAVTVNLLTGLAAAFEIAPGRIPLGLAAGSVLLALLGAVKVIRRRHTFDLLRLTGE